PSGTILVAENAGNQVDSFTPFAPAVVSLVSGVSEPVQAVNDGGDLIVTLNSADALVRIAPNNTQTTITSGGNLDAPRGVAIDAAGNYIVASLLNDRVVRV